MIRLTSAIMISAACAAMAAVFIPGLAALAAGAAQTATADQATTAQNPAAIDRDRAAACTQSWPYYEPPCLRDDRRPGERPRVVRIIAIERLALNGSHSR